MNYLIAPILTVFLLITSCATTTNENSPSTPVALTSGRLIETEITDSSPHKTFTFYSSDKSQYSLKISSYLFMCGLGASLNGYPVVYPAIIVKDKSGKIVTSHLVARNAIPPGLIGPPLHLESYWSLHLMPRQSYTLIVMHDANAKPVGTEMSGTATIPQGQLIDISLHAVLRNVKTGKLGIQLQ